jgi:hypothetical protein
LFFFNELENYFGKVGGFFVGNGVELIIIFVEKGGFLMDRDIEVKGFEKKLDENELDGVVGGASVAAWNAENVETSAVNVEKYRKETKRSN